MKKIIAMLLVLTMLLALSAAAMADETPAEDESSDPRTLSWITAWRAISGRELAGSFYQVGDLDVDVWIPDEMIEQTDIAADCYLQFEDSAGSASVMIHRISLEGCETLEEFEDYITGFGSLSSGIYWINGYNALVYMNPSNDTISADILITDGTAVEFTFGNVSDQDANAISALILTTIQPHTLTVEDVALMIDGDLNVVWGENKDVTYKKDGSGITVNMWEDGIDADTVKDIKNWDAVKESKISFYELYASVLENFSMDDVALTLQYTDAEEELSFLTIENGEITYDVFAA